MTKKLKLSPWHDGSVKPVHIGVYERQWGDGDICYTNWTGTHWSFSYGIYDEDSFQRAAKITHPSYAQSKKWRGILK